MKVLILTQYFYPVKGAAAKRTRKFARFLKEAGHDVTVLTGMPSYPTGKLEKRYQHKLWLNEEINGLRVKRVWELPVSTQDSTIKRLINMITFTSSAYWSLLWSKKFDAVVVSSPSFLSGIPGMLAAGKKGKFYFDVRDLWPDSAIELGALPKTGFLTEQMKKLEKKYYHRSTQILTATPGIKNHLIVEGINPDKITVILNSVDTDLFKPQPPQDRFGFGENDFICGYIGNHSRVYDLKTVLMSAEQLKDRHNIKFVFIGEGESKKQLMDLSEHKNLLNVKFVAEKSLEELPNLVNAIDIGLAPISNLGVSQESFPSKISEYFACGKPVVASLAGDMKKIIEDNQAGFIYKSGDAQNLTELILALHNDRKLYTQMAKNARQTAVEIFSDQKAKEKITTVID